MSLKFTARSLNGFQLLKLILDLHNRASINPVQVIRLITFFDAVCITITLIFILPSLRKFFPECCANCFHFISQGKKFVGVNCGTNDAKVFTMSSTDASGKRTYKCSCKDTLSTGAGTMYCIIHYWECPA